MNTKDIDNKIPIYQLDSKEKVLKYYVNWTKKGEYNKNMISWNYQAPQNTVKLFNKHAPNKDNAVKLVEFLRRFGREGRLGRTHLTGVEIA